MIVFLVNMKIYSCIIGVLFKIIDYFLTAFAELLDNSLDEVNEIYFILCITVPLF